jgi:hypothetical protein
MSPRVTVYGKVNSGRTEGAEAKASVNSASESYAVDPKLGELPMARMKSS